MGELVLVTGGARSGKSLFAESLIKKHGENALYIATAIAFDDEMQDRIRKHREQRPSDWETIEAYKAFDVVLDGRLEGKDAVMLDCVTIMVSNIIFEKEFNWERLSVEECNLLEMAVRAEVEKLLRAVENAKVPFIMVTNELGMGIVPESALPRMFRDVAGRVNQLLAAQADEVYFCVSGIPVKIKGVNEY